MTTGVRGNPGWCAPSAPSYDDRLAAAGPGSGEADVQDEVPEPQIEYSAAGPMHDGSQQHDAQDYHDHPEEEHNNAGDGIPGDSSRSSHYHQLPTAARLMRRVCTCDGGASPAAPASRPDGSQPPDEDSGHPSGGCPGHSS